MTKAAVLGFPFPQLSASNKMASGIYGMPQAVLAEKREPPAGSGSDSLFFSHLLVRVKSVDDQRQKLVDVGRESEGLCLCRRGRLGFSHCCDVV